MIVVAIILLSLLSGLIVGGMGYLITQGFVQCYTAIENIYKHLIEHGQRLDRIESQYDDTEITDDDEVTA